MKSPVLTAIFAITCFFSSTVAADSEKEVECLTRNIYFEAGNESFAGKLAVAQVTINRSKDPRFPSTICSVIQQTTKQGNRTFCQFSWYCDGASLKKPMNGPVYTESMEVAKKVLLEGFRLPSVKDAMYFHGDYINPGWKRERVAKIGRHIFYK